MPNWGTIDQAAETLGVSRDTVRRMISSGKISGRRISQKLIRVDMDTLAEPGDALVAKEKAA